MCKKNVMIAVLSAMLLLGSAVAHAGDDVFSVSFYAFNQVALLNGQQMKREQLSCWKRIRLPVSMTGMTDRLGKLS